VRENGVIVIIVVVVVIVVVGVIVVALVAVIVDVIARVKGVFKKKEVKGATMPPGLLSKLCQKLKTDNIKLPPAAEKKLVFGNNTKIKLKNYEIDWFNPEVINSTSIEYLKKNECPPSTHESQLLFLMKKFEPGEIKLTFSNAIGKVGKAAH
jgi:hypothetical protein